MNEEKIEEVKGQIEEFKGNEEATWFEKLISGGTILASVLALFTSKEEKEEGKE